MPGLLSRVTHVLALAIVVTGVSVDASFAEKMSPGNLRQLCQTAGGTFFKERNGKFACMFPTYIDPAYRPVREDIYCTARGECERITWCGGRPCSGGKFPGDKTPGKKPPKPTKLEGALTAGTADQRGAGVSGGTTAAVLNPNLGGSATPTNSALSGSTRATSTTPAAPTKSAIGISKPSMIPTQLAERLRRLQQQQQR